MRYSKWSLARCAIGIAIVHHAALAPLWGAAITFHSTGDGDWRGEPPPWEAVAGGTDHAFPVAGDTARILGHNIALSADEAVAVLDFQGDVLNLGGRQLTVSDSGTWASGNLLGGGWLQTHGTPFALTSSQPVQLGVSLGNNGRLILAASSHLSMDSGNILSNAASGVMELQDDAALSLGSGTGAPPGILNHGLMIKTGAGLALIDGGLMVNSPGTVEVRAGTLRILAGIDQLTEGELTGGIWEVFTNATLDLGSQSIVTNSATILLDGVGASIPGAGGLAANRGSLELLNGVDLLTSAAVENSGQIHVGANASFTVRGDLTQTESGQMRGNGTIGAVVNNQGRITPGDAIGVLTIGDALTLASASRIEIEIGGAVAGEQFDQLTVNGAVQFGGTLALTLTNGFSPALGNRFRIINYSSHSGQFASITGADLGPDLTLFPAYQSSGLELIVIPSTLQLVQPTVAEGAFSFGFDTVAGVTYVVEFSESLNPPNWQLFDVVPGDGSTALISDFADSAERYYRVRLE